MPKVIAKLRCLDMRGETTHTRWGHVSFDRDGLAELEVDEDDLQMLRDIKWLYEPVAPPQEASEPQQEPPPLPEAFDTTDQEVTPPKGSKKAPSRGSQR